MENQKTNKAVIMAGGAGTRLWPVSRKDKPKQFQAIASDKTMLQETYLRLRKKFAVEDIYVSTNAEYIDEVKREILEIPPQNVIAEPLARGTAGSIALTMAIILAHDSEAIISMFPADHLIQKEDVFLDAIDRGEKFLMQAPENVVTFGVIPTYPETGYGYIKQSTREDDRLNEGIHPVERFVEKPDAMTAQKYLDDGTYYWNSGMYMFDAVTMRGKFTRYVPDISKRLDLIHAAVDTDEYDAVVAREYPHMDKINFEYAIIENDADVVVAPLDLGWSDVGSWTSLKDTLVGTGKEHLVRGQHIDFDSENLLVYGSKKLITTIGVKDLIIVDTEDAILICHKDKSQMVSDVVKKLEASNKIEKKG